MAVRIGGRVFISYRRDDAAGHAGRVHDRLAHELGKDLLFMDVDEMPLGVNFVKELEARLAFCDVLVAMIGPNWLNVRDKDGRRRLDDPNDFVRLEIAAALQQDIAVVPILLEDTPMPSADQLPKDLQKLPLHHGMNVRHSSFHIDMDKLIRGLKGKWRPADWRALFASSTSRSQNRMEYSAKQEALLKSVFGLWYFHWLRQMVRRGLLVLLVGLFCWVLIEPSSFLAWGLLALVLLTLGLFLWWWHRRFLLNEKRGTAAAARLTSEELGRLKADLRGARQADD
jgi:hypothetical protein